jgi:hypothetical protein
MIEVDPRTRSAMWGFFAVLLGAGWAAYGIVGGESQVFLAVMVALSIVLAGVATFVVRVRRPV